MRAFTSPPPTTPGTGPERAHQRPGASVLPEGHRLPPGDTRAGAGGGGSAPPSASEGPGISYPGGSLCPWAGSPRTGSGVAPRPRHSGPSGDPPERLRSASWCQFRPCLGRWLLSGSLAVEMAAIRDRKEVLEARIFWSPPRSLPSGYALIPGSRHCCTSDWSRGEENEDDMGESEVTPFGITTQLLIKKDYNERFYVYLTDENWKPDSEDIKNKIGK